MKTARTHARRRPSGALLLLALAPACSSPQDEQPLADLLAEEPAPAAAGAAPAAEITLQHLGPPVHHSGAGTGRFVPVLN